MVNMDALYEAISLVFTFQTMMWLAIGVFVGVGVGAMPGLTATTGVALFSLALSFKFSFALSLEFGPFLGIVDLPLLELFLALLGAHD